MDADQQAGLAGVAMLVHDLLWWGGLAGALVLLRLSVGAARAERTARPTVDPASGTYQPLARSAMSVALGPAGGPGRLEAPGGVAAADGDATGCGRLLVVAGATAAASGVHAVMVLGHSGSGWMVPLFFAAASGAQAWQAWRLLLAPTREQLVGVVALALALLLVWGASRTVGVMGPAESVGPWDAAVVVWQATCVVVGTRLLRAEPGPLCRPPTDPRRWPPGAQVMLASTALTLLLLPGVGHG